MISDTSILLLLLQGQTTRRNLFSENSRNQHSTESFYGRRRTVEDSPVAAFQSVEHINSATESSNDDIHSMLAEMQRSITTEVKKVQESVSALSDRLDKIEEDFKEIKSRDACSTPTTSSAVDSSGGSIRRKRQTPTALSVNEKLVYLHGFHIFC